MSNEETSYIEKLEETYRNALTVIDTEVPKLIKEKKEMQGLMVFHKYLSIIGNVYALLNGTYKLFFNDQDILKKCGSSRLNTLSHDLVATSFGEGGIRFEDHADIFLKPIYETGIKKKEHWGISTFMLTEIEYMINLLKILVEPDFIPLNFTSSEEAIEKDRYITKSVKIAVWQRDQGKCVECDAKERLEYDHIIPVSKGGSNTERNIQLLCENCNRKKSAAIQ